MENKEEKGIFERIFIWFKNITVKGLLGVILLAFVIIILLLSVSYIPGIMTKISSSLSAALYSVFVPAEKATVTVDKKIINSGENFNVNFKKGDMTNGFFTISYACNLDVDLLSIENGGSKMIDCDTPYYLLDNETSIKIRPTTDESIVRLMLTAAFENNDTQKSETVGVVRITIKNDSAGVVNNPVVTASTSPVITTPLTPTYTPPTVVTPSYTGKPDLAVRILQVGTLISPTNLISPQTQFTYSDTVGIKFEIRNDGDANTGTWYFTATLPSLSTPTYNSGSQISLKPGESIIFTLGFSNLTNQNFSTITINVDPQNNVQEEAEHNNIVTSTITNTSYNSNYYYNNYNNGCYVNGFFTYNCGDYYTDWFSDSDDLEVSCYADPENPEVDERVRWYADVEGGDGDYNYDWTGTDDLDSSSEHPSITYDDDGRKRAYVTVKDGDGNTAEASCSVYVD